MAKIVKTNAQETALKEITEKLKVVAALNPLFEKDLDVVSVKINGSSFALPFPIIAGSLKDYRKKLISEISSKAKANSIELDEKDLGTLGGAKTTAS